MKTQTTTLVTELETKGLVSLIQNELCSYEENAEYEVGAFHDIVCVQTGEVYGFVEPFHSDGSRFYAANEKSYQAYKNNASITVEL